MKKATAVRWPSIAGGGRSLERTALPVQFPCIREIYREFGRVSAASEHGRFAESVWRRGLQASPWILGRKQSREILQAEQGI